MNNIKVVKEFDENNNCIYQKDVHGYEQWYKYDENNNLIYFKRDDSCNCYYKWENNNCIAITEQEFKQIERTKLYLNNKRINRFSLMDI